MISETDSALETDLVIKIIRNPMRLGYLFVSIFLVFSLNCQSRECAMLFTDKQLLDLKAQNFAIDDPKLRADTAVNLLSCLGHSNPRIRDGVVYEGLSRWLRGKQITSETTLRLFTNLIDILEAPDNDANNFTLPFAALVLSEVVRVDRITPYLSNDQRQYVVSLVSEHMVSVGDYRGFDDKEGWRHSVAHTADIILQLALNKQISKVQLDQLLTAISSQIVPANEHFYVYGEPKRLAMPLAYIVLRGLHSEKELMAWFTGITKPTPFDSWTNVYNSNQGLAKLHNTRGFLYSLLALTGKSENPQLKQIQPLIDDALKRLN